MHSIAIDANRTAGSCYPRGMVHVEKNVASLSYQTVSCLFRCCFRRLLSEKCAFLDLGPSDVRLLVYLALMDALIIYLLTKFAVASSQDSGNYFTDILKNTTSYGH